MRAMTPLAEAELETLPHQVASSASFACTPEQLFASFERAEDWWTWLFIGTLVFGIAYFLLFPGMGAFAGVLGWSSQGQYEDEVAAAYAIYGPILAGYAARPIPELAKDPKALEVGGRIFRNRCATCHGSDARGFKGYPNLTDDDWIWGGEP